MPPISARKHHTQAARRQTRTLSTPQKVRGKKHPYAQSNSCHTRHNCGGDRSRRHSTTIGTGFLLQLQLLTHTQGGVEVVSGGYNKANAKQSNYPSQDLSLIVETINSTPTRAVMRIESQDFLFISCIIYINNTR